MLHLGVAITTILAGACAAEPQPNGARLEIVVAAGRVEMARGTPYFRGDQPPAPDAGGETDLSWQLVGPGGEELAAGFVPDSRIARYETFDDEDSSESAIARAGAGSLIVEIPDLAGTLRVRDADGALLGELAYQPLGGADFAADRGDGKADINFATDVIGEPVLLAGDGVRAGKFNVIIVPEGYRLSELARFHQDVTTAVAELRDTPGYREHGDGMNIWYQDVKSATSGIAEPGRSKDTAFNIEFGDDQARPRRCIMPSTKWSAVSVGNLRRFRDQVSADVAVVLANVSENGGCARASDNLVVLSTVTLPGHTPGKTLAHELGHALFRLADEYETANPGGGCGNGPNLTTSLTAIPWRSRIAAGTPVPTPTSVGPGVVGAFVGGGYCTSNIWRPELQCLMRSTENAFCSVCRDQLEQGFERRRTAIRDVTITNLTGARLYVRCQGPIGSHCSGYASPAPGASATLQLLDDGFELDTSSIPDAPVRWNKIALRPPSAAFSIYANAADPFSPPGSVVEVDAAVAELDAGTAQDPDAASGDCGLPDVVINEVQTAGATAIDEFVELHNPCASAVDLTGARLVYRSAAASGATDTAVLLTLAGQIPAGGYFVVGSATFAGTAQQRPMSTGLGGAGGAVGLRSADARLIDSVGWGTASAANPLIEGEVAPAPPARQSLARVPDGADSGHNATDLVVRATPTPGATNL